MEPRTKLSILLQLMEGENWVDAIKFASAFPDLGPQKAAIRRAASALLSPQFYREMGQSPEAHMAAGIEALRERYLQPR